MDYLPKRMNGGKRGVTDRRRQSGCKGKPETPQTDAAQFFERKNKRSYRLQPSPKQVKEKRGNRPPPPKGTGRAFRLFPEPSSVTVGQHRHIRPPRLDSPE